MSRYPWKDEKTIYAQQNGSDNADAKRVFANPGVVCSRVPFPVLYPLKVYPLDILPFEPAYVKHGRFMLLNDTTKNYGRRRRRRMRRERERGLRGGGGEQRIEGIRPYAK